MSLEILSNRAKGEFPLSIGTSVALEKFFGVSNDNSVYRETPPYKKYDCVCINLSTLVRNMIASIKSVDLKEVSKSDFVTTLRNEIEIIRQLFEQYGENKTIVCFYYNHYHNLNLELKHAKFKPSMTDNQLLVYLLERNVPKEISFNDIPAFENTHLMITHGRRNNILLTHNPLDLLFNSFTSVALLESHTGKVKLPAQFNTKLKSAPENMPFNKITLQIYGDKAGTILPLPSKERSLFSEEASKLGVNSAMDIKRFIARMKESKEPSVKALVSRLK